MRKKFKLLSLLLALIVAACMMTACGGSGSGEESTGETIEWSLYSAYGPEDGTCCEVWQDLADQIYDETNGQLKINIYWYGQHPYEGEEMLKIVKDGTCELAHFYSGYVEGVEPALSVESLPLLLPSDGYEAYDILTELWGGFEGNTDGTLEALLQEKWNATMVHCMPASPQRVFTVGYDATTDNSLKGHKIRTYSTATAEFVKALGGTPVSISLSETYTSLSTNLVDGLITSTMFGYNNGVFDYVDNVNKWEISAATDGLIANKDALAALPDDVRETFLRIMKESATKPETKEIDDNDALLETLQKDEGVVVNEPTPEFREEIRQKLEKTVWAEWLESSGDYGQKILDQINSISK